jgi:aspartate racemase
MPAGHIGIVACSAEGAALCYRTICMEAAALMGEHDHPEITLHGLPLARYMEAIHRDDWDAVGELMLVSARKLAEAGATVAICPDNTIHQAFDYVAPRSPLPWLHIADVVAQQGRAAGFARLGILGTKYLMEGPVYPPALSQLGLQWSIPGPEQRERINTIIFKQLVNGIFTDESRAYFNQVMETLKRDGCDAAVLGCTEIPLIVIPDQAPLPTLDSTRLLACAALRQALQAETGTGTNFHHGRT